jgi:hypothetical protein
MPSTVVDGDEPRLLRLRNTLAGFGKGDDGRWRVGALLAFAHATNSRAADSNAPASPRADIRNELEIAEREHETVSAASNCHSSYAPECDLLVASPMQTRSRPEIPHRQHGEGLRTHASLLTSLLTIHSINAHVQWSDERFELEYWLSHDPRRLQAAFKACAAAAAAVAVCVAAARWDVTAAAVAAAGGGNGATIVAGVATAAFVAEIALTVLPAVWYVMQRSQDGFHVHTPVCVSSRCAHLTYCDSRLQHAIHDCSAYTMTFYAEDTTTSRLWSFISAIIVVAAAAGACVSVELNNISMGATTAADAVVLPHLHTLAAALPSLPYVAAATAALLPPLSSPLASSPLLLQSSSSLLAFHSCVALPALFFASARLFHREMRVSLVTNATVVAVAVWLQTVPPLSITLFTASTSSSSSSLDSQVALLCSLVVVAAVAAVADAYVCTASSRLRFIRLLQSAEGSTEQRRQRRWRRRASLTITTTITPPSSSSSSSSSSSLSASSSSSSSSSDNRAESLVFLGGSCNPTTWRHDVAMPFLERNGIRCVVKCNVM